MIESLLQGVVLKNNHLRLKEDFIHWTLSVPHVRYWQGFFTNNIPTIWLILP